MTIDVQNWIVLWLIIPFALVSIIVMSRLAVHTQKHLASFNERDRLIDTFVWIYRHTSRRPR